MDIPFREQHPLENSLVLSHIFKHCGLQDLKSCRLVSRLWRDASRLTWRSNAFVSIYPFLTITGRRMSDFKKFSTKYANDRGQILERALFTNYYMYKVLSTWFYNFWGTSIKVLKLHYVDFKSGNRFLKTIFQCCQNLEKLTLSSVTVGGTRTAKKAVVKQIDWAIIPENRNFKSLEMNDFKWNGVVWMEVLIRIPSLQALTLDLRSASSTSCQDLFQSLKMIREQDPTKLRLKLIDLGNLRDISPAVLPVLLDLKLHLETLVLGSASLRNFGHRLVDILDNHSSSLKRLSLDADDGWDTVAVVPRNFQSQRRLESLQELRIFRYLNEDYSLANFLKLCPNLRKLHFSNLVRERIGVEDISGLHDVKLNYCSELSLSVPRSTSKDLEKLIKWLPNIKKLKILGLNNEMFSMVCAGWPNLVSLEISMARVDDSGVTGLDIEDVINFGDYREIVTYWRPITVPRANITCLRDLQRLCLRGDPIDLGRCAFVCGIELLPNLRHLKVDGLHRVDVETRAMWSHVCARYPWPDDED